MLQVRPWRSSAGEGEIALPRLGQGLNVRPAGGKIDCPVSMSPSGWACARHDVERHVLNTRCSTYFCASAERHCRRAPWKPRRLGWVSRDSPPPWRASQTAPRLFLNCRTQAFFALYAASDATYHLRAHGASPSGKATDFDSVIRRFDPSRPSHRPTSRSGRHFHHAWQFDRHGQPLQAAHDALPNEHAAVFVQL